MRVRSVTAIAAVLLFGACSGEASPVATGSSVPPSTAVPTSAATSTTAVAETSITTATLPPTTTTVPFPPPGEWRRVDHDDEAFGQMVTAPDVVIDPTWVVMSDVITYGDGFLAVGEVTSFPDLETAATVWRSADGLSWTRFPADAALFDGNRSLVSVAEHDGALVAVGSADGSTVAVWTSDDGSAWERVPHQDVFGGRWDHRAMNSVAASGTGWVAVGEMRGNTVEAAAWVSPDGATWSEAAVDSKWAWESAMVDVGRWGDGFVAVGWVRTSGGETDAAVWVSPDGSAWSRVADDEASMGGPGTQEMTGLAAGDGLLVAVGFDTGDPEVIDLTPAVWTSTDGSSWLRAPDDGEVLGGDVDAVMRSAAGFRGGFVAVGEGERTDAVVLTSRDGFEWLRVDHDDVVFGDSAAFGHVQRGCDGEPGPGGCIQYMTSVATDGDRVVVVGHDTGYVDSIGAAWVWLPTTGTDGMAAGTTTSAPTIPVPTTTLPLLPPGPEVPDFDDMPPGPRPDSDGVDGNGCTPGSKPLWDGPWYGYIGGSDVGTLEFDLACFFTGDRARAEAALDGVSLTGSHYVRNQNLRLKTLPIHPDAVVYEEGYVGLPMSLWPTPASHGCPGEGCGAWIYLNNGEVTAIVIYDPYR